MAVSEDGEPDGHGPERLDGQAGVSLTQNPAPAGARKRQSLRDRERSLLERERRLLERERQLLDHGSHAFDWVGTTSAGTFWSRLNAVDFMNSSLQFAALAVLCLFPFLIWYQRVYDQPPAHTLWRQLADRLLWLAGLLGYLTVQDFSFIQLKQFGTARAPIYAATFILAIAFYWWTPHVLLLGRVAWRRLFPTAIATALCVTGLGVFSALVFSSQIVSSHADYGPIGVVIVLLSYLLALGVCIHLGAVAGRIWDERRSEPPADPEELPAVADR